MSSTRPVVLLTGFGPFPRVPVNATSVLVPRVGEAAQRSFAGSTVIAEVLQTGWVAGPQRLEELYQLHRPLVAVHFGVSHRATGFAIETRGRNHCAATPDCTGALPPASRLSADAPEFLASNWPAALIVERLRQRGLPARVSRDAGGYLCNALLYRALELSRRNGWPTRSGFVHLPEDLIDPRRPERQPLHGRGLSWDDVVEGSLEIIATCLGRPPRGAGRPSTDRRFSPSPSAPGRA
jgi:pyroglutamyl-peptidase